MYRSMDEHTLYISQVQLKQQQQLSKNIRFSVHFAQFALKQTRFEAIKQLDTLYLWGYH